LAICNCTALILLAVPIAGKCNVWNKMITEKLASLELSLFFYWLLTVYFTYQSFVICMCLTVSSGKKLLLQMITWEGFGSRHGAFPRYAFRICLKVSVKLRKPISNESSMLRIKSDTTQIQSRLLLIVKPTISFSSYTFPWLKCRLFPIFLPCLPWISNIFFYSIFIFSNYVHLHVTATVLYSFSFRNLFDDSYVPVLQYPICSNFSKDSP